MFSIGEVGKRVLIYYTAVECTLCVIYSVHYMCNKMILKYDRNKSFFVKASPQYLVFFVFYTLYCEFICMFSDNYETFQGKDLILAMFISCLKKKKRIPRICYALNLSWLTKKNSYKQTNEQIQNLSSRLICNQKIYWLFSNFLIIFNYVLMWRHSYHLAVSQNICKILNCFFYIGF